MPSQTSHAHSRPLFPFGFPLGWRELVFFLSSLGDFRRKLMRAYGQSKLANVLFTYALARRLEGTGVTVNCLHPGAVATNIWTSALPNWLHFLGSIDRLFCISPEQGALTSIYLASSPEVEGITGKYFEKCRDVPSAKISYDQDIQTRLWAISETLTHFS